MASISFLMVVIGIQALIYSKIVGDTLLRPMRAPCNVCLFKVWCA